MPHHNENAERIASSPTAQPLAKPAADYYRRNLPHFQGGWGPLYITFRTKNHWVLPEAVRATVLKHCIHDHERKMHLFCAIVMPDHVHLIYQPLSDNTGQPYSLQEIVGAIKSTSAHSINKRLKRKVPVWQDESFDHVIRSHESVADKVEYIKQNAVRRKLCRQPEDYPWLWVDVGAQPRATVPHNCK